MDYYINLSLKAFESPDEGWYNLHTNRRIKSPKEGYMCLKNPKVTGKPEIIKEFCLLNRLKLSENIQKICPTSPKEIRNIQFESINDIPKNVYQKLTKFSFNRLFVRGKVHKVIDGDTIDLFCIVPLSMLTQKHLIKKRNGLTKKCNMLYNSNIDNNEGETSLKILIKLRCRLFGIDTADNNKDKKKAGTEYLKSLLDKCENKIYTYFLGKGARGRDLVEIFEDPNRQISINKKMLKYEHPIYGKLAYSYFGGTKIQH